MEEQVRHIKQLLRSQMNGPVSQSMRERGVNYRMNFGVELPRLQALSQELREQAADAGERERLAIALWKEEIRECRLLAPMLYPRERVRSDLADLWISQMRYPEEAECCVMHLLQWLPDASTQAFCWMASDEPLRRLCGFLMMGRLLMRGLRPSERDAAEMLDHIQASLADTGQGRAAALAAARLLGRWKELQEN